jgi:hypothetical protein
LPPNLAATAASAVASAAGIAAAAVATDPSHCRQISLQLLHLLLLFLQLLLQNLLMVWQSKVGGEIRLDIWKSNIQNGYVIIE